MSQFNVYLKDVQHGETWGEGDAYEVGNHLKALFDEVCQRPETSFSTSDFWYNPNPGDIGDHELLVYLVPNQGGSVIRGLRPNQSLGPGGTTLITSNWCLTEVYHSAAFNLADANPWRGLAVLCFHELMHNKLKRGNILHTNGGGGLARGTVFSNYTLSATNKVLMASALSNKVPQYKGAL